MKLLLDLGNTRLKWALSGADGWSARGTLAWKENLDEISHAWKSLARPECVLGSSVVDTLREAQVEALVIRRFEREVTWVRTPAKACGVRVAYAEPHRLGVDRFLAMVAAHASGQAPCVLAGIGTALTLDALDADGRHLGGLIAPGPLLMQQALLGATVRVQTHQGASIRPIADNTADAVVSGCWQAAAALIERFAGQVGSANQWAAPRVLLDGGDAEALRQLLAIPAELAADSVLRGLLVWADVHS